jgi:succinoglycan biosynthesis protein ExoA
MTGSHGSALLAAVLIPARDEVGAIDRCLEHVLAQDLPRERIEVVVVDGGSTDGTGERAQRLLEGAGFGRVIICRNERGTTPSNLNMGLGEVEASLVCRVDARSLIPRDYVRRCSEILNDRPEIAVVGGAQVAVARSGRAIDVGIARALNNRYGMGLSRYRRGATSGAADTVYLGAFRTKQLRDAGGWDERFPTNQDFELNRRMAGLGLVWFDADLAVEYLPRRSLGALLAQYRRFGQWKVTYWALTRERPRPRQVALLLGPVPAVLLLGLGMFRRPARTILAAFATAVIVDEIGSSDAPAAGLRARVISITAMAAVGGGWWSGVAGEAVARGWRRTRARS